jgi:hypothetical protein
MLKIGVKTIIGPDYDGHQWKDSQDPWEHAICARVLCRLKDGKPPSRERVEEAFEAVDRLFTQFPRRGEKMPHAHIFPLHIYFIMAIYLGHLEKARKIL